jgi:hypothetical protein
VKAAAVHNKYVSRWLTFGGPRLQRYWIDCQNPGQRDRRYAVGATLCTRFTASLLRTNFPCLKIIPATRQLSSRRRSRCWFRRIKSNGYCPCPLCLTAVAPVTGGSRTSSPMRDVLRRSRRRYYVLTTHFFHCSCLHCISNNTELRNGAVSGPVLWRFAMERENLMHWLQIILYEFKRPHNQWAV